MQNIRLSLRSLGARILMGKNTLIKKAIKSRIEEHPEWEPILNVIHHNVGLIFTKGTLSDLKAKVLENTVPAIAKVGSVAPDDVVLPKQVTTLEPTKTNFFAALDIATKITRGCVEILNDVKLCEKGKKVGSSEAALLQMLDIKPFTYGLKVTSCYDSGAVFDPEFAEYTESEFFKSVSAGISQVAAVSLALQYPTLPAFPHTVSNGFKNLVAVCLETNYMFPQAEAIKKRVENPDAFAPVVVVQEKKTEVKKEEKKAEEKKPDPEPEEKSEEDGGGLLDFF